MTPAAVENPRSRQEEERGQFLTATPVADFMALAADSPDPEQSLIRAVIESFIARRTPGAEVLGIQNTALKRFHLNYAALAALGVTLDSAAKIPDVIVHHRAKNWLVLIEAVTNAGPVDGNRRKDSKSFSPAAKRASYSSPHSRPAAPCRPSSPKSPGNPKSGSPKTQTT